jgi:glycine/D-amino acid oxidase-like deaminating enzyme
MKLRTGEPLWLATRPAPLRTRRLQGTITCDVAVIGAGITGALVANALLGAKLNVVVIDKREAGLGSTVASTGLLLYQPDASIEEISRRHSRRTARRVYELGRQAIHELGALVRTLPRRGGWRARHTLYVASKPRDRTFLRREARRTATIGFPVALLSSADLNRRYGLRFPAALEAPGAAEVHALALNRAVLRKCQRNPRFQLLHGRARSVREQHGQVRLTVGDGGEVRARYVIVAAGYESRQFVRSPLVAMHSTYVIASKPFPPTKLKPLRCLMWETARPYFYLRTTADHRIVFGGLDDPFATPSRRARRLPAKTRRLENLFAAMYPNLAFRAEYAWSGAFADTTDGLPCIGPARPGAHVLYALGYGGNGITFSQIAAKILRDLCLGRPNADAALFGFHRMPSKRSSTTPRRR